MDGNVPGAFHVSLCENEVPRAGRLVRVVDRRERAKRRCHAADLASAHESLGRDTNRVAFVSGAGDAAFASGTKEDVADRILTEIVRRLA